MKVFMIGGTGLLGSETARELIKRGHEVVSIALPPIPSGANLPPEMKIELGNYLEMSDEKLLSFFEGCEGFIFAAGVDERVEGPPPIYDLYKKYNIDPLKRLLRLAKMAGVKHAVVFGSYFSHFAKIWPEKKLTYWHPYIRSRIDQEEAALAFAGPDMDVAILEIPYVFGAQPGRKPVWVFLVEAIRNMKGQTMYPKGGTAMVTVRQIGQAAAGALERNKGGNAYPLGYYNMTWKEMLAIFHKHMGMPERKVVTIPTSLYRLNAKKQLKQAKEHNIEPGLHPVEFSHLMCSNLFIDKSLGCEPLGVTDDDIDAAIGQSVRLSMEILDGKTEAIGMKGE